MEKTTIFFFYITERSLSTWNYFIFCNFSENVWKCSEMLGKLLSLTWLEGGSWSEGVKVQREKWLSFFTLYMDSISAIRAS